MSATIRFSVIPRGDIRSFRMITSQLVCEGLCRQKDIQRVFGVSPESVKRNVRKYREGGVESFYQRRRGGRGGHVLTVEKLKEGQRLLDLGWSRRAVSDALNIRKNTLDKAIQDGRLHVVVVEDGEVTAGKDAQASSKSERSTADACSGIGDGMGTACQRSQERFMASVGVLCGAETRFEKCLDVSFGGVLCCLPALEVNGLFRHLNSCFSLPKGFYKVVHIFLLLAYMALCRIRTVERLQYEAPGELGKLIGLDRIPEVRCLRSKLDLLSSGDSAKKWAGHLSADWFSSTKDFAGTLYVDGHVRVYHGRLTKLPRRYVSRQKLCLRGTTDYWVNDAIGQPFFVIDHPVDEGLLRTLRNDIVPRLLREVAKQATEAELREDRYRPRFILVFDREGYSPEFFKKMWEKHRIACLTYHKYPKASWPEAWFKEVQVSLPNGEQPSMRLAELGSWIGGKNGLWVREVRKLTASGHQTSLVSTAYSNFATQDAAWMFSRWCQENFLRYMIEHFGIDLLSERGTKKISDQQRVVNPKWRQSDAHYRSLRAKLARKHVEFSQLTLNEELSQKDYEKWQKRKAEMVEIIGQLHEELETVREQRKSVSKHITFEDLPEADKFEQLAPSRKHLLDTIKMIAYRAEIAMAVLVREHMARTDDARALLRDLYRSEADLLPDEKNGVLEVRVHHMANPRSDRTIRKFLEHLNETEMTYPDSNLRLVYSMAKPK